MSDVVENTSSFLSQAQQNVGDLVKKTANIGLFSYDPATGKFGKGTAGGLLDEGIGEITGRNVQRKALMEQRDQITAAATEQRNLRDEERLRRQREEVRTSNFAASIRERAIARSRKALGGSTTDFLGS